MTTTTPPKQNFSVNGKTYSAPDQVTANQLAAADLGVTIPGASGKTPLSSTGIVQGAAPAGSTDNGDGTFTSSTGIKYTSGPSTDKVGRYPSSSAGASDSTTLDQSETPESEESIQSRIEDSYATQISAINSVKADLLQKQGVVNANNEGRTRATAASSGVLGQDIGNENQDSAAAESAAANKAIEDASASEIAALQSKASDTAESEYNTEKGNYQTYLKSKISDTQAKVGTIAASTPLEDLPQTEYDSLYASAGFDNPDEFNAYYEASRTAALQGVKLTGSDTTGYYMPVVGADGKVSYQNVIKAKPVPISGSQYGNYVYDPTTGDVQAVSQGSTSKVITSGGRLWLVPMKNGSPTGGAAQALTPQSAGSTAKVGWDKASTDQQLAVQSWIEGQAGGDTASEQHYLQVVQSNPDAFLTALNSAFEAGTYIPAALDSTATDSSAADAAAQSAQDAADAAANSADSVDTGGSN